MIQKALDAFGWAMLAAVLVGVIGASTLGTLIGVVLGLAALLLVYIVRTFSLRPLREGDRVRYMHGLQDVTGVLGPITGPPGKREAEVTLDGTGGLVSGRLSLDTMQRVRGDRVLRRLPRPWRRR